MIVPLPHFFLSLYDFRHFHYYGYPLVTSNKLLHYSLVAIETITTAEKL